MSSKKSRLVILGFSLNTFIYANYSIFSDIFKSNKIMNNFQEFLSNIFQPLFEVTNDPNSNLELHKFLTVSLFLSTNLKLVY